MKNKRLNILGNKLEKCSDILVTGYTRNGCCESIDSDLGKHIICAEITKSFLLFSLSKGNDLITPNIKFNFPGLREGDRWCVCLNRWLEAYKSNSAPAIIAKATNLKALDIIPMEIIKEFAIDIV